MQSSVKLPWAANFNSAWFIYVHVIPAVRCRLCGLTQTVTFTTQFEVLSNTRAELCVCLLSEYLRAINITSETQFVILVAHVIFQQSSCKTIDAIYNADLTCLHFQSASELEYLLLVWHAWNTQSTLDIYCMTWFIIILIFIEPFE